MKFQQLVRLVKHPLFLIIWIALAVCSYFFLDLKLAVDLRSLNQTSHYSYFFNFFEWVTHLGISIIYFIGSILLILYAMYIRKNKKLAWAAAYLFFTTLLTGIVCLALKIPLGRARPVLFFQDHLYGFYFWKFSSPYWSLPSGHVITVTGLATACSFLLPRYWGAFFAFAFLVDISRIICNAHYVSDVMIAAYLGFIIAYWLYGKFKSKITSGDLDAHSVSV